MNEVKITVDDRTKTLRFKEALTSGSKYRVVVDGGASVCGAAGCLVLTARGELVAFAELADGAGELSTNTREMAEVLERMPVGALADFDAVLHKKDDAEGENVAIGICRVVAAGGAWTDDTTGALTLYKGEKGDVGATGADGKDGKDGTDGTDGKSAYEIAVARGFEGTEAEWLKSLVGLPGALNEVQLVDAEGNKTDEFYEVLCKEVDGEKVLVLEQTKIDGVAAKSNAERAEVAAKNAAASASSAAASAAASERSEKNAAASASSAAESAAASKQSETNAAASASSAAESALLAASNLTFMGSAVFTVDNVTTAQTKTVTPEWVDLNSEISDSQIVLLYHSRANTALTVVSGGKTYSRTPAIAGPCCLVFRGVFDNDYNLDFTITKASTGDPQQFVVLIFGY